jgi:hypothetical protein
MRAGRNRTTGIAMVLPIFAKVRCNLNQLETEISECETFNEVKHLIYGVVNKKSLHWRSVLRAKPE